MKIIIAKTFKQKLIGFMGQKNIKHGIYFPSVNKIHTYFMKEKIDIIGLNKENIITEIISNVPKNKIIILRKSTHTLELPNGQSKKYHLGQKVKI